MVPQKTLLSIPDVPKSQPLIPLKSQKTEGCETTITLAYNCAQIGVVPLYHFSSPQKNLIGVTLMSYELNCLTPEERSAEAIHSIDPGFVNYRLIETLLRSLNGMEVIDNAIRSIPDGHERWWTTRINHIYSDVLLAFCKLGSAPSLSWLASQPNPNPGQIICSTDMFRGTKKIFKAKRAEIIWIPCSKFDRTARLKFSTEHISSTTHREALSGKSVHSYVARLKEVHGNDLVLEPLVMGFPWVEGVDPALRVRLISSRFHFYEQYVEDIDEFSEVKKVPSDINWSPMRRISERAFKTCRNLKRWRRISRRDEEIRDHSEHYLLRKRGVPLWDERDRGNLAIVRPALFACLRQ